MIFQRIVCLLAAALLAACARTAVQPSPLKVMTYNIHHAEGIDGRLDLERIAAVIRAEDPDIVCLQEVDQGTGRTGRLDMPALLGEMLAMRAVFGPNLEFEGGQYGNLTLTRLPVAGHENIALPTPEGAEPRGALRVTVDFEGEAIDVYNTHLGLDAAQRLAQARKIAGALDARGEVAAILAGDLNEELGPRGFELDEAKNAVDGAGVRLLYRRYGSQYPGWLGETFPADAPTEAIDYIFCTPPLRARGLRIIKSEQTRVASDHLPVVMEVMISR